jgi:hypothetical protein
MKSLNSGDINADTYVRYLDLSNATAAVQYTDVAGVTFKREYIADMNHDVVVVHFTASKSGKLNFEFTLTPCEYTTVAGNKFTPTVTHTADKRELGFAAKSRCATPTKSHYTSQHQQTSTTLTPQTATHRASTPTRSTPRR